MNRCEVESRSKHNWLRPWWCSLPAGHAGPHRAYENHDVNGGPERVAWVGPWADGRPHPSVEDALREEAQRHGMAA